MNSIEQQIIELTARLQAAPDDADALYRRGTLRWRLGERAAALTDLNAAARLDPGGPAPTALSQLNAIMSFFNPDLYNP